MARGSRHRTAAPCRSARREERSPRGCVPLPRWARTAKTQQVKNQSPARASCPAGSSGSLLAAALSGGSSCRSRRRSSGPSRRPSPLEESRGRQLPAARHLRNARSPRAAAPRTAPRQTPQRGLVSPWLDRAGTERRASAAAQHGSWLPGHCRPPGWGGRAKLSQGCRDGAQAPRTTPSTEPQQPPGRGCEEEPCQPPQHSSSASSPQLVHPRHGARGGTDGCCLLTCHHLEGGEVDVVLGHFLEQLVWGESGQGGRGQPSTRQSPPGPCSGRGTAGSGGVTHPRSGPSCWRSRRALP